MSGFKFIQPGRPCVGSMSPGDYEPKTKSKTPIADKLSEMNRQRRRELKLKEEYCYRHGEEDN